MIIIRFHGGLGNQMFEYTFYKYMEEKYPGLLKADVTWFDRNRKEHQGFELKKVFGIDMPIASYEEIGRVHEYYEKYYPFAGMRYLARKLVKLKNSHNNPVGEYICDFGPTQYTKNPVFDSLDVTKDWYIEGVYCSDSYLDSISVEPKRLFHFIEEMDQANKTVSEKMANENSVAIHVRRGDYVGNVFDIVTLDYYKKAVEIIKSKVSNPVFYVFSDDMQYIKDNFSFIENFVPMHNDGASSYMDMRLISCAKHMIIANSTFSYWGAVIGEKQDSIIIAPKKYKSDEDIALARKNWILV